MVIPSARVGTRSIGVHGCLRGGYSVIIGQLSKDVYYVVVIPSARVGTRSIGVHGCLRGGYSVIIGLLSKDVYYRHPPFI